MIQKPRLEKLHGTLKRIVDAMPKLQQQALETGDDSQLRLAENYIDRLGPVVEREARKMQGAESGHAIQAPPTAPETMQPPAVPDYGIGGGSPPGGAMAFGAPPNLPELEAWLQDEPAKEKDWYKQTPLTEPPSLTKRVQDLSAKWGMSGREGQSPTEVGKQFTGLSLPPNAGVTPNEGQGAFYNDQQAMNDLLRQLSVQEELDKQKKLDPLPPVERLAQTLPASLNERETKFVASEKSRRADEAARNQAPLRDSAPWTGDEADKALDEALAGAVELPRADGGGTTDPNNLPGKTPGKSLKQEVDEWMAAAGIQEPNVANDFWAILGTALNALAFGPARVFNAAQDANKHYANQRFSAANQIQTNRRLENTAANKTTKQIAENDIRRAYLTLAQAKFRDTQLAQPLVQELNAARDKMRALINAGASDDDIATAQGDFDYALDRLNKLRAQ